MGMSPSCMKQLSSVVGLFFNIYFVNMRGPNKPIELKKNVIIKKKIDTNFDKRRVAFNCRAFYNVRPGTLVCHSLLDRVVRSLKTGKGHKFILTNEDL